MKTARKTRNIINISAVFLLVCATVFSLIFSAKDNTVHAVDDDMEINIEDLDEINIDDFLEGRNAHGDVNNNLINNNNENANANAAGAANKQKSMSPGGQKAVVDYAMKGAQAANNMIMDIYENGFDSVDYLKYGVQMIRAGSSAAASAYFDSPAAGAAVDGCFEIVLAWFHLGEKSSSDMQKMEARLNDKFDEISNEIGSLKQDVADLSKQFDKNVDKILSQLDRSFEAYYAKTQVTDFLYSTSGNFSYDLIRNYLHGNTSYSLYYDLATALANKEDDAVVKELYDRLYYALMHYDAASGVKSNADRFTEYYIGDINRRSIGQYYYEYLRSNQSYLEENPSLLAAQFASQLYYDYMTMLNVIRMINVYQLTDIILNGGDMPEEELMNARYYYGKGENDYVTTAYIKDTLIPDLDGKAQNAYQQMLSDLTEILGLGRSYLVNEPDGKKRYVTENEYGTFGNVIKDEVIYLNQVTAAYCDIFGLDSAAFEYEFKSGNALLEKDKKQGCYRVATTGNFTGSVIYNGTTLYTVRFRVGDNGNFIGGSGTAEDPFVIATAEQYKLMYSQEKNNKSFVLVADLDFNGQALRPLASEADPYNGVFNGGGHVIKRVEIKNGSANSTSLFGVIGNGGVVKNLEIEGLSAVQDNDKHSKKLSTGGIAGTNNGQIISCFLRSSTVNAVMDSDLKSDNLNKAITVFAGAIAGENNGYIGYCKVESSVISGGSSRFYSANKDTDNRNSIYAGGIVGANNAGIIENCYVANGNDIHAFGSNTVDEGLSLRYPYVTAYAGGIAGIVGSIRNVKNVYSEATSVSVGTHVFNEAITGGSFKSHCEEKTDVYIPNQKSGDINNIKGSGRDVYKITSEKRVLLYGFIYDEADEDPVYHCSPDLVYVGTDTCFRMDDLALYMKMGEGEDEKIEGACLDVIGVYGFDVINTSKEEDARRTVSLNLYDRLNNSVYTLDIDYYVKKNAIYKIELPDNYKRHFELGAQVPRDIYGALNINELNATYYDGTVENVAESATFTLDTSELGYAMGKLVCGEFELELDCSVICNAPYDETSVEILYKTLSENKDTCVVAGYKTSYCSKCGKMEMNDVNKEFAVVIRNEAESGCSEAGYTGDLYIEADGEVLTEDMLIETGSYLPVKPHNFNYEGVEVNDYTDGHSHFCVDCYYQETHMFRTIENTDKVICECVVCGYETALEQNSRAAIEKLPRVVVSDAYAVTSTKEVKVFVDLHASTGITAANFTVNFDPRLELVSCKPGNILNGRETIDTFRAYKDHVNVTLVQRGAEYKTDGTILTLVFRLPEELVLFEKYNVEVTNKDNKDKFTDQNGNKTDFVAYAGGVIVVSHLPGDVNGDDVIDLVDSVLLSNYITMDMQDQTEFVNDMLARNPEFNISYGDVSLDGSIDISDVVQILRYTTGGYETNFVSKRFEVLLNYNDGTYRQDHLTVLFENGYTFGSIEQLPELQKQGYKFDGWYTDFGGKGVKVTNDTPVFYNREQYKQTLYAHFIPNTITFDANGGYGEKPTINYGSETDLSNTYNEYYVYFAKETYVAFDLNGLGENKSEMIPHYFLGWALTPDGDAVYSEDQVIDLSASGYNGVGNLVLYAVWSTETVDAYIPSADGYTFLGWTGADKKAVIWTGEEPYAVDKDVKFYAKWRKNTFSFVYHNPNGETYTETITRDINNYAQPLQGERWIREGYDFMGWSVYEQWPFVNFAGGSVMTSEQAVSIMDYMDGSGYVHLYSVWKGRLYTIAFDKNSDEVTGGISEVTVRYGEEIMLPSAAEGFTPAAHKHFTGWSLYPSAEPVYSDGEIISNLTTVEGATITLYAHWAYDVYRITYIIAGTPICTDEVSYGDGYTFLSEFEGYVAIRYYNSSFTPGQVIESWTDENMLKDIYIVIAVSYKGEEGNFEYNIRQNDKKAVILGYKGPLNGTLIIPNCIRVDGQDHEVVWVYKEAFYNSGAHFDKIVIAGYIIDIDFKAFMGTQADAVYMSPQIRSVVSYAFAGMEYVEEFVLAPNSAADILSMTTVKNLYFYGNKQQWENSAFRNKVNCENVYFYRTVYDAMEEGYKYWTYNEEKGGLIETFNG